jgi:hypothetical protein
MSVIQVVEQQMQRQMAKSAPTTLVKLTKTDLQDYLEARTNIRRLIMQSVARLADE